MDNKLTREEFIAYLFEEYERIKKQEPREETPEGVVSLANWKKDHDAS